MFPYFLPLISLCFPTVCPNIPMFPYFLPLISLCFPTFKKKILLRLSLHFCYWLLESLDSSTLCDFTKLCKSSIMDILNVILQIKIFTVFLLDHLIVPSVSWCSFREHRINMKGCFQSRWVNESHHTCIHKVTVRFLSCQLIAHIAWFTLYYNVESFCKLSSMYM